MQQGVCIGAWPLTELLMQDQVVLSMHLKVFLALASVNRHWQAIRARGCVQSWVLIHVLEQQRLTNSWLVVQSGAAVAMPTSPVTPWFRFIDGVICLVKGHSTTTCKVLM